MSVATKPQIGLASRAVNALLAVKPIANLAKTRARNMMIERAESIGVPWRDRVAELRRYDWDAELAAVANPELVYPDYYLRSFHAYEAGNLSWDAALEVEVAAYAVHARIWDDAGKEGDPRLRQSYHSVLQDQLDIEPGSILDLGCSVGMSTLALQQVYPKARLTGVDLSPYFLAVARYNARQAGIEIHWHHAAAEATQLPPASYDLVSACLMFHELPQSAAKAIFQEARRVVRSGGYFTLMDMNPHSQIYAQMPPFILTLLKSTEPYLDQYFTLNLNTALIEAGFEPPIIVPNSPRHRTVIAKAKA